MAVPSAAATPMTDRGLWPARASGALWAYLGCGAAFVLIDAVAAPLWLRLVLKGILMPLLAVVLWAGTRDTWLRASGAIGVVALLFSALGDVLLAVPGRVWFGSGLGAFLVAQACYVVAFLRIPGRGPISRRPLLAAPFLLFLIGVNALLTEVGVLRWPVLVYSVVIVTMAAAALDLRGRVEVRAAGTVFAGALLFVLSDSLIAVGTFTTWGDVPGRGVAVMATYLAGQALITLGLCRAARVGPPAGRP